jgi:hypothetical protein
VSEIKYVECRIQNIGKRFFVSFLDMFLIMLVNRRVDVLVFIRQKLQQDTGLVRILIRDVAGIISS